MEDICHLIRLATRSGWSQPRDLGLLTDSTGNRMLRGSRRLHARTYLGQTGVPSDHLFTVTKNTAMGGKLWSCGYDFADEYQ